MVRDPKYRKLVDDIGDYVNRVVSRDNDDAFGSMVLISCPKGQDLTSGDIKGWASPGEREKYATPELLMMAFYSLTIVLLAKEEVGPEALHRLVMSAAIKTGMAAMVVIDEEGNAVFDSTLDDDIPQA